METTTTTATPAEPVAQHQLFQAYINHILRDNALSQEQTRLWFATTMLSLQETVQDRPHDLDNIRSKVATATQLLLLAVASTGATRLLEPTATTTSYKEDPQQLTKQLVTTAQQIITTLACQPHLNRIDNLSYIINKVDNFITTAMKLSGCHYLDNFIHSILEYHNFWHALNNQREEEIINNPHLQYQLESTTIFPLSYCIDNNSSTGSPITALLYKCGVSYSNKYPLTLRDTAIILAQATSVLMQQQSSCTAIKNTVALACNCHHDDVDLDNLSSLTTAAIQALLPPTFSEQWNNTYPYDQLPVQPTTTADNLQSSQQTTTSSDNLVTPNCGYNNVYIKTQKSTDPTLNNLKRRYPSPPPASKKKLNFDLSFPYGHSASNCMTADFEPLDYSSTNQPNDLNNSSIQPVKYGGFGDWDNSPFNPKNCIGFGASDSASDTKSSTTLPYSPSTFLYNLPPTTLPHFNTSPLLTTPVVDLYNFRTQETTTGQHTKRLDLTGLVKQIFKPTYSPITPADNSSEK